MSDAVKWTILVTSVISLIIMVFTLPVVELLDFVNLGIYFQRITETVGSEFYNARGLINYFLDPASRQLLSGIMIYLFFGWAIKLGIKISTWVLHFVFK